MGLPSFHGWGWLIFQGGVGIWHQGALIPFSKDFPKISTIWCSYLVLITLGIFYIITFLLKNYYIVWVYTTKQLFVNSKKKKNPFCCTMHDQNPWKKSDKLMVFHKLQTCKLQLLKTLNFIAGEFQRFFRKQCQATIFCIYF